MRVRVRGVWEAEVNRGEKVIGIRKFEETECRVSFVQGGIRKRLVSRSGLYAAVSQTSESIISGFVCVHGLCGESLHG